MARRLRLPGPSTQRNSDPHTTRRIDTFIGGLYNKTTRRVKEFAMDIGRSLFATLTAKHPDSIVTLARRGQMPFEVDQKKHGRGYSLFEALLCLIADEFVHRHGMNLTGAAELVSRLAPLIISRWYDVADTSADLYTGRETQELIGGRVDQPADYLPTTTNLVFGTWLEIVGLVGTSPVVGAALVNVSRSASVLRMRAAREGLDVPVEFWCSPPEYRARPEHHLVKRMQVRDDPVAPETVPSSPAITIVERARPGRKAKPV